MTDRLNELLKDAGIRIDFEKDVVSISKYAEGGSITERHILFALSLKIIEELGKGTATAEFVKEKIGIQLPPKQLKQLEDPKNPYYEYDLLGTFKAGLTKKIFIPAEDEVMHVSELIKLSDEIGSLLCYPYLGDVAESITGDKKPQKFEDDYLDLLFDVLKDWRIDALTYMPSRNSMKQIRRLQQKCVEYNFFEISGEDINSPRQSFICNRLALPEFSHLVDSTWTLIEYEKKAGNGLTKKPER